MRFDRKLELFSSSSSAADVKFVSQSDYKKKQEKSYYRLVGGVMRGCFPPTLTAQLNVRTAQSPATLGGRAGARQADDESWLTSQVSGVDQLSWRRCITRVRRGLIGTDLPMEGQK